MTKKITVYTTTHCAFCLMVKKYLDSKGQSYDTINLDEQPEEREKIETLSGVRSVPVTVVESEKDSEPSIIVGWNPAQLSSALGIGS